MIKGWTHEVDIRLGNIQQHLNIFLKYNNWLKGRMDKNIIIVRDFNTPQTSMDRFSKQKINKATEVPNDTIDQLDLIDKQPNLPPKIIRRRRKKIKPQVTRRNKIIKVSEEIK